MWEPTWRFWVSTDGSASVKEWFWQHGEGGIIVEIKNLRCVYLCLLETCCQRSLLLHSLYYNVTQYCHFMYIYMYIILLSLLSWRCLSPSMDQHLWYIRLSSFFTSNQPFQTSQVQIFGATPKKYHRPKTTHHDMPGGCGIKMSKMLFLGNASLLE